MKDDTSKFPWPPFPPLATLTDCPSVSKSATLNLHSSIYANLQLWAYFLDQGLRWLILLNLVNFGTQWHRVVHVFTSYPTPLLALWNLCYKLYMSKIELTIPDFPSLPRKCALLKSYRLYRRPVDLKYTSPPSPPLPPSGIARESLTNFMLTLAVVFS